MTFSVRTRLTPDRIRDRGFDRRRDRAGGRAPAGAGFTIVSRTAESPEGPVATVAPTGEVDLDTAYRIREAVDAALLGHKPAKIVIDLGGVNLIDSVGIGVLVSCYHAAAACRVPLVAASPSCTVYRQLWVSGLVGLFRLATPHAAPGARDLNAGELTTPDPAAA